MNTTEGSRKLLAEELYRDLKRLYEKCQIENGQLKSELDRLEYENKELKKELANITRLDPDTRREMKIELKRQEYINRMKEQNKNLHAKNKRLIRDNTNLIILAEIPRDL